MNKVYPVILLFILFGCIKKKEESLVVQAMVDGQWKVTNFKKAGSDVTTDFANYKFQFKTNFTVDAINNGTIEKTGSWNADATSQTITSNFPSAVNPLVLLNGTWQITNNSWTWVEASQTVNGELLNLRLDKQ
ncbi:MAG: hypothetical protein ACXVBZ_09095 [Flavisolibacter sp.]